MVFENLDSFMFSKELLVSMIFSVFLFRFCFFKKKKNLFKFNSGCAGASVLLGLFSSCGEWGSLFSWCGFSCLGSRLGRFQELQHTGSIVVVLGLRCSEAWGIFSDQGSNPYLLHWQVDTLPLNHQGMNPLIFAFIFITFFCFLWVSFSFTSFLIEL